MTDLLLIGVETLLAATLLASCGWTSYVVALQLMPATPASVRWSAACIIAYWLLIAVFLLLASLWAFNKPAAATLWGTLAVVAHSCLGGADCRRTLQSDVRLLYHAARKLSPPYQGGLIVLAAIVALRLSRGLVAPPLAWDALTYHLLKAGRWVQAGGVVSEAAPDAWGYYEYFAPYGDIIWAWAMLPVSGDALLAPAGVLVWLSLVLGAYAAARALGGCQQYSLVAAAVIGSVPAALNAVTSAYVDNLTAAMFLLGSVFVVRAAVESGRLNALLAAAALGAGAGVKVAALPYLMFGLAILALATFRSTTSWSARVATATGVAVAAALAIPPYARAWIDKGSPLYPLTVRIGSTTVVTGNEEMNLVHSGLTLPQPQLIALGDIITSLTLPVPSLALGLQFLGLGPAALVVLGAGLAGAWTLLHRKEYRLPVAYLVGSAVVAVLALVPDSNAALVTLWVDVLGRHLIVPFAVLAVLAAAAPHSAVRYCLGAALFVNLALVVPLGWGALDAVAVALCAAWAVWAVMLFRRLPSTWRGTPRAVATVMMALLLLPYPLAGALRQRFRYRYYEHAFDRSLYDMHPLDKRYVASWPVWNVLDRLPGVTVAVAAGWDGIGHNWYRYPLLGSRLQNTVVYIPITRDGSIVDYRDQTSLRAHTDFQTWTRRLERAQVDYLALLPPQSPEFDWVVTNPDLFEPAGTAGDSVVRLYRFRRDLARSS